MTEELERLVESATDLINAIKSAHGATLGCALAIANVAETTFSKVENQLETYPDDEVLRYAVAGLAAAREHARVQVEAALHSEAQRAQHATRH
jgi:hypothetical protein